MFRQIQEASRKSKWRRLLHYLRVTTPKHEPPIKQTRNHSGEMRTHLGDQIPLLKDQTGSKFPALGPPTAYIYIYIYLYVCVCSKDFCIEKSSNRELLKLQTPNSHRHRHLLCFKHSSWILCLKLGNTGKMLKLEKPEL